MGTKESNNLPCSQLCDVIAQLVEHCTSIADVMGLNPIEAACDNNCKKIQVTARITSTFRLWSAFRVYTFLSFSNTNSNNNKNTPYSKMAAILVFFRFHANWPLWPRFQM